MSCFESSALPAVTLGGKLPVADPGKGGTVPGAAGVKCVPFDTGRDGGMSASLVASVDNVISQKDMPPK